MGDTCPRQLSAERLHPYRPEIARLRSLDVLPSANGVNPGLATSPISPVPLRYLSVPPRHPVIDAEVVIARIE